MPLEGSLASGSDHGKRHDLPICHSGGVVQPSATGAAVPMTFTPIGESSGDFALRKLHTAGSCSLIVFAGRCQTVTIRGPYSSVTRCITPTGDTGSGQVYAAPGLAEGYGMHVHLRVHVAGLVGTVGFPGVAVARMTRSGDSVGPHETQSRTPMITCVPAMVRRALFDRFRGGLRRSGAIRRNTFVIAGLMYDRCSVLATANRVEVRAVGRSASTAVELSTSPCTDSCRGRTFGRR